MVDQKEKEVALVEKKLPLLEGGLTYESLLSFIDKNIHSVQLGVYSVAFFGLVIVARSVRPFKKFTKPSEIPKSFFRNHVQLSGQVMRIDFHPRPVLLIDHHPALLSSLRRPGKGLKVNLEGIDLMPNGVSWLQTIIVGSNVKFTLISPYADYVSSIVDYNNKDVAIQLVKLGFASVATYNQHLDYDKLYTKYYQSLLKMESKAESKGLGVWSDASYNVFKYILSKLSTLGRFKSKSLKAN